jgi:hypothetical protein
MKLRLIINIWIILSAILTPSILVAQSFPYGTARTPKNCPSRLEPKRGAPSVDQAKLYFTCDSEVEEGKVGRGNFYSYIRLIENLTMQVSPKSRPANSTDLKYIESNRGSSPMDTTQPVYDIRGSYDGYVCYDTTRTRYQVGENCKVDRYTSTGICFRSTFGDWYCRMKGTYKEIGDKLPPPQ